MNHKWRDRVVVAFCVLLYVVIWIMSLGRLFADHFYDASYALHAMEKAQSNFHNTTALAEVGSSYYSPTRYVYFLPHVVGAVVWWNFYFLQLMPRIRRAYNYKVHRILGRCLFVAALLQIVTGLGMAITSHSNIIKLVSFVLAAAATYCLVKAWNHAVRRQVSYHKYWVLRLVLIYL